MMRTGSLSRSGEQIVAAMQHEDFRVPNVEVELSPAFCRRPQDEIATFEVVLQVVQRALRRRWEEERNPGEQNAEHAIRRA